MLSVLCFWLLEFFLVSWVGAVRGAGKSVLIGVGNLAGHNATMVQKMLRVRAAFLFTYSYYI